MNRRADSPDGVTQLLVKYLLGHSDAIDFMYLCFAHAFAWRPVNQSLDQQNFESSTGDVCQPVKELVSERQDFRCGDFDGCGAE
jgi:hypothetical protein